MSSTGMEDERCTVGPDIERQDQQESSNVPEAATASTTHELSSDPMAYVVNVGRQMLQPFRIKLDAKRIVDQKLLRQANEYLRRLGGAD